MKSCDQRQKYQSCLIQGDKGIVCLPVSSWNQHIQTSQGWQMFAQMSHGGLQHGQSTFLLHTLHRSHLNFCIFWFPSDLNFSCWLLKSFIQRKPVAARLDHPDNSRKSKITILTFMAFQSKSFLPKYSCFSLASCSPWASRLSIMASPSWAFFQVLGRADTKQAR